MCGILGFNFSDKELAQKLHKLIAHRGPDDFGVFSNSQITLGHRRLSIVDLSKNGAQPMSDSTGKYVLVYNGEIFNFKELREELINKGYSFNSTSDTEVLLNGYIEYGKNIVSKLNGQFAFCMYDMNREELFLARDQVGINPLYYYLKDSTFIFGSELKVLMQSGVINKHIDEFSLNYYLMYGHTPRKRSILQDVYKLEPGHYMRFDLKSNSIVENTQYWKFTINEKITSEEVAKKKILDVLDKSVQRRMIADVPVGAFLSGGVDSSAIVAMMSKYTTNLNTFSVKFDYGDFDESEYAKIISKQFKTKHHVVEFGAKDVEELIPKLVYHYDEPFADHSMIPTFLVSKVAREHVTVSLSGDGGDELFGGYEKYQLFELLQHPIMKLPLHYFSNIPFLPKKIERLFHYSKLKPFEQYANLDSYRYVERLKSQDLKLYQEYKHYFTYSNFLNNAINCDMNLYLPCDILTKVDRASLGNSLESRPPFLDIEMIQLASSIDNSLKLKGKEGKYILKKALEEVLPREILYRKKKGFGSPIKYYLKNELKHIIEDNVLKNASHSYFKKYNIEKIFKEFVNGEEDHSRLLWSMLMFNLWYEKWMK